jgi:AcrR family transcriptional regulator
MPRLADPQLERRILDAAERLWKKGGGKALTMRAVAQAARTTTPTVYQRFASRRAILHALLNRIQHKFLRIIECCESPQELFERYIDFALEHPLEYELFFEHQDELFHAIRRRRMPVSNEPRPGVELAKAKLALWLGGAPEDYVELQLALWALSHGAAMLLISKTARNGLAVEVRKAASAAASLMLKELAPTVTKK